MMKVVLLAVLLVRAGLAVQGREEQQELRFLQDYIAHHRVNRMLLINPDDNQHDRKPVRSWFRQLPVLFRVLPVNGSRPIILSAMRVAEEGEPGVCTDRCAPSLVVTTIRDKKQLDLFMMFYEMDEFRRVYWIVFGTSRLIANLQDSYIALDNRVVLVLEENSTKSLALWEVYKAGPDLPLRSERIGSWSGETGLNNPEPREPFGRRTDLTGLLMRVATVPFAPFVITKDNGDGTLTISGNHAGLFKILQDSLNFTSTFFSPIDGGWGAIDPNTGMMNGMIGLLQRKEADIAVNALDITPTRNKYVDYPVPLDSFGYWLVMERPGRGADWKSYTAEFSYDSWCIIITVMISFVIIIHVFTKASPSEDITSVSDAAVFVISACCNMGYYHPFRSLSTRILIASLFMTTIIVYTHYTSFLTATFAVVKIRMPFEDLQGLYAKRREYHLGMLGDSSLTDLLRTSREPFLRDLWTEMLEPNPDDMVPTNKAGFERMMTHEYVFLTYSPTYLPTPEVTSLSKEYFKVPMSWPVQKNSHLLPILNYHIRRWLESGQYNRLWLMSKPRIGVEPARTRTLGYDEMFTAFALLGCGMSSAILITLLELMFKPKRGTEDIDNYGDDEYAHVIKVK